MYILCKLLYITVFALLSAAPPYLPLYYHDVLRFSSDQIGFTIAIAPFIQSIACPLWTYLVDKRPRLHGPVMAITSFLGGLAVMGIMLVGRWVAEEQEDTRIKTSTLLSSFSNDNSSNTRVVVITCAFALAFAFFTLPNTSLVDSAVVKMLGPNKILYGKYSNLFFFYVNYAMFIPVRVIRQENSGYGARSQQVLQFCWSVFLFLRIRSKHCSTCLRDRLFVSSSALHVPTLKSTNP